MNGAGQYTKYAKDAVLVIALKPIEWIEPLILLPILTKTLGVQNYGIWSQLNVTISLLVPVSLMGLGAAIDRFLGSQENPRQLSKGFFSVLTAVSLVSLLLSLLMLAVAGPLSSAVFGGAEAEPFIKIGAILVFLMALSGISTQYFIALRRIKWYAAFSITQIILELSLLSYLALNGFGLHAMIIAVGAIRLFIFILGMLILKRDIPFALPSINGLKPYLAFGLPLLFATAFVWLFDLSNRYVIGYFANVSWVGVYSVSYQIGSIVSFFWAPFGVVLLPVIAPLYEKGELKAVTAYLSQSLKFFFALAIPALFGLSVLSKSILATLTTPDFAQGYLVIIIVGLAKSIMSTSLFFQMALMLAKKTRIVSVLYGITAGANLVMNLILIPLMGILGAAIATLASFTIHFGILYALGTRELPFEINFKFITKSVVSALIMGIVVHFLNSVGLANLILSIAVGAVVYFVILVSLRGFSRNELRFLKMLITGGKRMNVTEDLQ